MTTNEEQMMSERARKMPSETAVHILRGLIKGRQASILAVDRKRSWRDSEKAMTVAEYRMQIDALVKAINSINAHDVDV